MTDLNLTLALADWGVTNFTQTQNNCALLYDKLVLLYPCAQSGTCYNPTNVTSYAIIAIVLMLVSFFAGIYYKKKMYEEIEELHQKRNKE